jgi:integrase
MEFPERISLLCANQPMVVATVTGNHMLAAAAFRSLAVCVSGISGAPFSIRAFNLRLRAACRALGVGEITAHGLRHSAATILLNQLGKDLREIQELLRHKNVRTTFRYSDVGYEQTRQTAEALSLAME